jgi:transcriptional regulator with XRE-family HTH domain
MEVVRILAETRQKQAISKYALSKRSGVSQQMIAHVERGTRKPSLEIAMRLAEGLALDVPGLFRRAIRRISGEGAGPGAKVGGIPR